MTQPSLIPAGHTAVMARRAPSDDGLDYFPTPPWAARAGAEVLERMGFQLGGMTCLEPACGGGHMAHGLDDYFAQVTCRDIADHGSGRLDAQGDFLACDDVAAFDWVITNPPFIRGEDFIRKGLQVARVGVAMLLRLSFLEGIKRHSLLHEGPARLAAVSPFAERVPMVKGRWDPAASSATAYAWFFFRRGTADDGFYAQVRPIGPGTRHRLSRPEDLIRFGMAQGQPLFDPAD